MTVLEISDLIVRHDLASGAALPVHRDAVLAALRAAGDRRGARIVRRLPHHDGVLDAAAVDRILVRTHTELQRLNEELRIADQLAELLVPVLRAVTRPGERARVVDVGCGIGYAIRWLAATGTLAANTIDAELCGVDFNAALIGEARRLAAAEGLECRFVLGDAFDLKDTATVYISSGVLHHLRGEELGAFFRAQAGTGVRAYCHFDIAATRLAPVDAWMFHRARMREPLGRHDGVASARRAHSDHELMSAARSAAGAGADAVPADAAQQPVLRVRAADPRRAARALAGGAGGARAGGAPPGRGDRAGAPAVVSAGFAVPVTLALLALVDGALAGHRAATGRSGLIRKRAYYVVAMRRGLAAGAAVLGGLALVLGAVLAAASDPAARYGQLTRAGIAMLWVLGPFAIAVLATLAGYFTLPRRPATFLILLGLGPLTLIRPWLTVAAGIVAAWTAPAWPVAGCAVLAAAGVLLVEPWVHRRWYADPHIGAAYRGRIRGRISGLLTGSRAGCCVRDRCGP
ncbi:class I SAM-dependent methyltransferase [Dactylosporangium sp. CS-033363]|uniref:class I SAM-dependent methyltransferase n=1 Tax=Dactylosporangium sp. CS-033363 TaxID=3239935 RepID=UPI003D9410AE